MEVAFQYQKKRSELGRQCLFSDRGPELIDDFPTSKKLHKQFILKDPFSRSTQLAPVFAEHYINTMRASFKNSGANHTEGGWPKDVNYLDEDQTKRYRKRIEKEDFFAPIMKNLFGRMEKCILQNNAINIYQQYFDDMSSVPSRETNSARTVNIYQASGHHMKPANHISWSPDRQTKIAVSHCKLDYQTYNKGKVVPSFIWEVENCNRPLHILKEEFPVVCMEYNMKDFNSLASGDLGGHVAIWDLRKGHEPAAMSLRENSFLDPVQNVLWIHSKTNTEFFSSSSDGMVKWWDTRNMTMPTETLILDYARERDQHLCNAPGVSVLEYESTIPTRYMIGTEQGEIIMGNRKGRIAMEKMALKIPNAHLGPILALQRNPVFLKNFLTVGDWTAKIWSEDCRESPIIWTPYNKALLTDGAWSPTKLSVFFTTRTDGFLDVWNITQDLSRASLSVNICSEKLTCLKTHETGKFVAVGCQNGATYLIELSKNLAVSSRHDKMALTIILERSNRRERILEARTREMKLKHKADKAAQAEEAEGEVTQDAIPATPSGAPVPDEEFPDDGRFVDKFVMQAENEFYKKLTDEKRKAQGKKGILTEKDSQEEKDGETESGDDDLEGSEGSEESQFD